MQNSTELIGEKSKKFFHSLFCREISENTEDKIKQAQQKWHISEPLFGRGSKNCMNAAFGLPDMWTAVMNVRVVMVPDAEQQCEEKKTVLMRVCAACRRRGKLYSHIHSVRQSAQDNRRSPGQTPWNHAAAFRPAGFFLRDHMKTNRTDFVKKKRAASRCASDSQPSV